MLRRSMAVALFMFAAIAAARSPDWRTHAEATRYAETARYAPSLAWFERLDDAAEDIHIEDFGRTPEGRRMITVIATTNGDFTPERARAAGKAVVLIQAGIHAGEIEGKDAGMALLRDLTVAHRHRGLLDRVVIVFVPVFNVDGHENASPFKRANQNGPREMGWRATAQRINLNRDYMKADAPEMRAWLTLWRHWQPDLLIDSHTTDGADYQYDLTWYLEEWGNQHPAVNAWQQRHLVNGVFPRMERMGHKLAPYLELKDGGDITQGFVNFGSGPRFATGYAALWHRPSLLIETHMLKDYRTRVRATYDMMLEVLRELDRDPASLREAVARADADTLARVPGAKVPLTVVGMETPERFTLRGVDFTRTPSDISGATWTRYDPRRPRRFDVPFYRQLKVDREVAAPAAYIVPAGWPRALELLQAHGLRVETLKAPTRVTARAWRLASPQWATAPFEGRLVVKSFESSELTRDVELPAGSAIVALDQPGADVAVHLLEPEAPDSMLRWGLFNLIFERREYGESRVNEQIARDLLKARPELRAEFEEKLRDPVFAADPAARLTWFYDRSDWADADLNVYPVWRVDADTLARLRR